MSPTTTEAEDERSTRLPSVSVVVPTVFRQSLETAVLSVLNQDYPRDLIEVVVVADLPSGIAVPPGLPVKPLFTGGEAGGGSARQLGVRRAANQWIAFLDDDDVWKPDKLRLQLNGISRETEVPTAISCRFAEVSAQSMSGPLPTTLVKHEESVVDYLFRGRSATVGRPSIPTSTLVVNRAAARAVEWDRDLRRHQDWDWLASFDRLPNRQFIHVPECLVIKTMGSEVSISASSDWRASLDWSMSRFDEWNAQTYCDFVAAHPLRYAVQARSLSGVRDCLAQMVRARRRPSLKSLILGLSGLLPRKQAQRVFRMLVTLRSRAGGHA